jgi:invasion protein IalB
MWKLSLGVELLLTFILSTAVSHAGIPRERPVAVAQATPSPAPPTRRATPAPSAPAPKPQSSPTDNEQQQIQTVNVSAGAGWVAKCVSESRQSPIECSIEQTLSLPNTSQLIASVLVRVPSDTRQPVMMIQLPVGIYLPAGLNLEIDDGKPQPVPLQMCDLKGCYASMQVSQDLLASLKSGKRLTMIFQNMAKNNITVPIPLGNFADAYQKIQ